LGGFLLFKFKMATTRPDIFLIRGDTSSIDFQLTEDGVPVDITGATVFLTAKPTVANEATDATAVMEVEVAAGDLTDPTQGKTTIPLSASDTDCEPGDYFYDIQVKKSSGAIVSIPARKLRISGDITRRTS